VERIAGALTRRAVPPGELHIGDDAAILAPFAGEAVASVDVAVAGVHLDLSLFPLEDFGFKAYCAALSDLAAMGARPRGALLGVAAPPGTDLEALHRGIGDAVEATGCAVVGGDLTSADQLILSVTVLGECPGRGALRRSGAQPGDTLLVTGALGAAAAGLRRRRAGAPLDDPLVVAHRRPRVRLEEGRAARGAGAHAMMDLSDGIGLDLHRFADASGVGFALEVVPVAEGATEEEALRGGEDYELLIATADVARLRLVFEDRRLEQPREIGRVLSDPATRTLRGEVLERRGFEHRL
jgi:thiamine-monophosphate kinase